MNTSKASSQAALQAARTTFAVVACALFALIASSVAASLASNCALSALQAQDKLSLAERRAVKAFQDEKLPALQKAIDAAAGFAVPLEIDWNAIALKDQSQSYGDDQYWVFVYFKPLASALKKVASDDMGKKALKTGLKKVVITYDEATAPASNWDNGLSFDKGTLRINFQPYSNTDDEGGPNFKDRVASMVKLIESKL
jgi:hypothetical protein